MVFVWFNPVSSYEIYSNGLFLFPLCFLCMFIYTYGDKITVILDFVPSFNIVIISFYVANDKIHKQYTILLKNIKNSLHVC